MAGGVPKAGGRARVGLGWAALAMPHRAAGLAWDCGLALASELRSGYHRRFDHRQRSGSFSYILIMGPEISGQESHTLLTQL